MNNLLTTESGYVLDARQGKILDEKITQLSENLLKTQAFSARLDVDGFYNGSLDVGIEGYDAIGVIGVTINVYQILPEIFYVNNGTLNFRLRSLRTGSASVTATFRILYVANN